MLRDAIQEFAERPLSCRKEFRGGAVQPHAVLLREGLLALRASSTLYSFTQFSFVNSY